MLTRCPQCGTTFRVAPEQLKARQGRVRCGQCQAAFNALETLVEETAPPPPAAPAAMPEVAPPGVAHEEPAAARQEEVLSAEEHIEVSVAEPEAIPSEPPAAEPETAPETEASLPQEPAPEPEVAPEPAPEPEPVTEVAVAAVPDTVGEPIPPAADAAAEFEPLLRKQPRRSRWPWALGAGATLMLLATQAAIRFRTEITVLYPETKPALAAACTAFGCTLSLPHRPELLGIETSDLHPDANGRLMLVATLRNRAPFAQEYPHLELMLTDTADQPLARRVLTPAEYLLPKAPAITGFGANSEIAINLAVVAPGVNAAGYRLYLFYP